MKNSQFTVLLISLLTFPAFLSLAPSEDVFAQTSPDVYVGVDVSYGSVAEAKAMIDQVSGFTNLVVIGSTQITWYPNKLTETFQYAYDKGLSFISLTPALSHMGFDTTPSITEWLQHAKEAWGDRLLGFYHLDEPGGRQLDRASGWIWNNSTFGMNNSTVVIDSYVDAANTYVSNLGGNIEWTRTDNLASSDYSLCTSDYALYWFDYKAGYDAVFAEFGWNYSRQLNVALCRGAAAVQNKEWGVMITWTYTHPPYIESGEELFNDLVLAYDNGAKYIVVFDGNDGWTGGILLTEHLDALQRFWDYVNNHPRRNNTLNERTAYILPEGYGYGFRGPSDHIWGLWEADDFSLNMSKNVKSLLDEYGERLDVIYYDGLTSETTIGYSRLVHWDSYSPPPPRISILSPENTMYTGGTVFLNFTLDKGVAWLGHSIDGQAQTALTGNTTLLGLSEGSHNVTVYAKDEFENMGTSETITFVIDLPDDGAFPVVVMVSSILTAVIGVGSLFFFKRRRR